MNIQNSVAELTSLYADQSWFAGVEINRELHNSIIMYVSRMDSEVLLAVPEQYAGYGVRVHFTSSKESRGKESLENTLERLMTKYGEETVSNVFYEIHDGDNRLTSFGDKYTELLADLTRLYNMFGFFPIYNYLMPNYYDEDACEFEELYNFGDY